MKEQSHKDEMAAALRSDFARLRARAPRDDVESGLDGAQERLVADRPAATVPPAPVARPGLARLLRRR